VSVLAIVQSRCLVADPIEMGGVEPVDTLGARGHAPHRCGAMLRPHVDGVVSHDPEAQLAGGVPVRDAP